MMSELFDKFALYFSYTFVWYAMVAGILIALCASLLGVTLVLKRFSLIGDGLSHVAFGAMAVAGVLQFTHQMIFILPATIACAVLLLRSGQNTRVKGDAAVAMFSVGALAIGYLLINLCAHSANISGDVCTTLFGSTSILTLTRSDIWLCILLSLVVITGFTLFYNKIFAVTFDENFARAAGTHAGTYNLGIAVLVAVIIVLAMNLVGALLISALIIFPALSAMRLFRSFRAVTVCAAILSVICAGIGLLAAIVVGTPVGSTIVAVDMAAYFGFVLLGLLTAWRRRRLAVVVTAGLLAALLPMLWGCGAKKTAAAAAKPAAPAATAPAIDLDLTQLSTTMLYTHVFYMLQKPEDYDGMVIKMEGKFSVERETATNRDANYCVVQDATKCCTKQIAFEGDPTGLPEPGKNVTVVGKFQSVTLPNGAKTCRLDGARVIK